MLTRAYFRTQFNFWTLLIACNAAALIVGAGFQIEAKPNLLSTFVCFGAITCGTAGVVLLMLSGMFSVSLMLSSESQYSSHNLKKCWEMALMGAALIGPGLLFALMMTIRSLVIGFD